MNNGLTKIYIISDCVNVSNEIIFLLPLISHLHAN